MSEIFPLSNFVKAPDVTLLNLNYRGGFLRIVRKNRWGKAVGITGLGLTGKTSKCSTSTNMERVSARLSNFWKTF